MIDVAHQINAVRRRVSSRMFEAGEARVVTVSQVYDTEQEDLWDACTNAPRISRWLLPVSGELRVGGRYQLEGNASGTVERCDPPKGFFATWEFGGQTSWVEVRIVPESADKSRLEVEHIAHVDDELWAQFGPGAVGIGWDQMLLGLALHLSSGPTIDPADAMDWQLSEEGRAFATESSNRWYEASVAAGEPAEAARAAADRTTAAYTTPPEAPTT